MIGQRIRIARRQFPLSSIQFGRQLFANDRHFGWRFDTNPHAAMPNLYDGDGNFVADEYPLADLSTEN